MKKFLCFFVSAACFASTFGFPHTWDSYCGDRGIFTMKDPSFVGLRSCEIQHVTGADYIEIRESDGRLFTCVVSGGAPHYGESVFVFNYDGEDIGRVIFWKEGSPRGLEISGRNRPSTFQNLDPFKLCMENKRRLFYATERHLIMKVFFDTGGRDVFVSATIAYDDLKKVVIDYGCSIGIISVG